MDENRCLVENFTVGRHGYGNVCFLGVTDVYGLDLDKIVFIVRKEIEVYPDGTEKPPRNQGLNKSAIVSNIKSKLFITLFYRILMIYPLAILILYFNF